MSTIANSSSIKTLLRPFKHRVVLPILKTLSALVVGYDITMTGNRLRELNRKLNNLERVLDIIVADPIHAWLYKNRGERMDATVDLFERGRREFHLARYKFACGYAEGKIVADIACGTGYGTKLIVVGGKAKKAIGVDIDLETIEYAKETHMAKDVEFVCASGDRTGIPENSIDVVVSFETVEHVRDDLAVLREFHRILRPGGTLICSTPNNWPLEVSPYHVRVYDRNSFEKLLSRCFDNIELYSQNSGTEFGFNHGQPAGIWRTTVDNEKTAECMISVCRKGAI